MSVRGDLTSYAQIDFLNTQRNISIGLSPIKLVMRQSASLVPVGGTDEFEKRI